MKKLVFIIILIICIITIISYSSFSKYEIADKSMIADTQFFTTDYTMSDPGDKSKFTLSLATLITENKFYSKNSIDLISPEKILYLKKDQKERLKKEEKELNNLFDKITVHTVKKGETLWSIAKKHDINIDTLIGANDISNMNQIKPGEKIIILPIKGILYNLGPGESLSGISDRFEINIENIIEANNIKDGDNVEQGRLLLLPGAVPEFCYKDRLEQLFIRPVSAPISSYYGKRWGKMHEGVDFSINPGTPIKAAGSGRVIYSGWVSGYGRTIIIEHQRGLRTLYAHNTVLLADRGEYVYRGEIISKSGNTGNTTGPNLHFEVQVNGRPANPLNYLRDN